MIYFWAPWTERECCERSSYFHELSKDDHYSHLKFFSAEVGTNAFQTVKSLPMFQIWKNGQKTDELGDGYSKNNLKKLIDPTYPEHKASSGASRPLLPVPGFFFIFSKNKKRDT